MEEMREHNTKWHEGRTLSLVFHARDEIADLPE